MIRGFLHVGERCAHTEQTHRKGHAQRAFGLNTWQLASTLSQHAPGIATSHKGGPLNDPRRGD